MEHSAAIVMNHCDCEAEQMMNNTRNEETVVIKVRRNHCDCEAEQMMNTGNEETVVTKVRRNHCDCEAEQMMNNTRERRDRSNQSPKESLRLRSRADDE